MPFFLRKAFSFGPFRFNLSKSGIGISAGVKGARVGIRPNGRAFTHLGRFGLYHRQELGLSEFDGTWLGKPDGHRIREFKLAGIRGHLRLVVLSEKQMLEAQNKIKSIVRDINEPDAEDSTVDPFRFKVSFSEACSTKSGPFWRAFHKKDQDYKRENIDIIFSKLCELNSGLKTRLPFKVASSG